MRRLALRVLGGFEARQVGRGPLRLRLAKSRALLAYLALREGQLVSRQRLCRLLWSRADESHARLSLRQTLVDIRQALGSSRALVIVRDDGIGLDRNRFVCDATLFERLAATDRATALRRAARLYRGSFLDGQDPPEAGFTDWCDSELRRLDALARTVLARLCNLADGHSTDTAIALASRLVASDPYDEAVHRTLMTLYARCGAKREALRQFEICRRHLREGLNEEPSPETMAVHAAIQQGQCESGEFFLGKKEVKNIARPVRVYRADLGAGETGSQSAATTPEPERPSIAVLPFQNLSGDPEQEYFADGIAEDLITELSRLRWLLVTARNSTFTYKGQSVDVRQVGRDLGVRYVVEGSVRKAGDQVRISVQLVDATTGNHIWAERYDRDLSDIFALQDEITETLVAALQAEVGEFERERAHRKPPDSLDAWESYQRGLWHLWQINAKDMAEARRLFQRAGDLDPNFAQAFAALGYTLYLQVVFSYADSPLEDLELALRLANKAVALDDKEAMAHLALGRVQTLRGEYDAAIAELRTAIDLNPSSALARHGLGLALMLTGQLDKAISELDAAIRLTPRDPYVWAFYAYRAWASVLLGDYEAAVEDARRAIRHPAANFWPHGFLASALALVGRREEAKIALDKLLELKPDFSPDGFMAVLSPLNPEALRPLLKTWIDGLRKAGLDIPDEPATAD